jgi:general L-amino acid transport system substrate-binding protein
MLGLDNKWGYNIIKSLGNYAELFDRNLGPETRLGLSRGPNELWNKGGLLYSPPFR